MSKKRILCVICIFAIMMLVPILARASTEPIRATINVNYQYDQEENSVIVTMESDVRLKSTKASWSLSWDCLTYTYKFKENTSYTTTVEDIYGNEISVPIQVTQIDDKGPDLEVIYEYIQDTNTVKATVKSDEVLNATKKSWTLSSDKKSYTYEFKNNTDYITTFEDLYGNETKIKIQVTQIQAPNLDIYYEYSPISNTVRATVTSDRKLQASKQSWVLSSDQKRYEYVFSDNTNYTTSFQDENGNATAIEIKITGIDKVGPQLNIDYEYSVETNKVTAVVTSNEELGATKQSWTLSSDKLRYTYVFEDNTTYTTTFEDKYGNATTIGINITQVDKIAPKITTQYILNDNNTVTVNLVSDEPLKATKVSWQLSSDQKTYSYTFSTNSENYATEIKDLVGNSTVVKIKFKFKQYGYAGTPNATVKYLYTAHENVLVKIISDTPLQATKKNWKLSADKKEYSYTFTSNTIYDTSIIDVNGRQATISIIINFFDDRNLYNGIDVSEYQKIIDWSKVKNAGIDFAIIRAGYRGYGSQGTMMQDRFFETNLKNAALNGVEIGIYFYSQAITENEAVQEANFVLNLISKYNIEIRYPIAIDTERTPVGTGRADGISKELRTRICQAFCNRIQEAGYKPMIYANKDWLLNNLNIKNLTNYDIWLAHYTRETDYKYAYTMWQYTSKGTVNGIVGNVDMDYGYKKY